MELPKRINEEQVCLENLFLFRKALMVYVVLHALWLLPVFEQLYHPVNSLTVRPDAGLFFPFALVNLISMFSDESWIMLVYSLQIILAVLIYFEVIPQILVLFLWFILLNLNNRVYPAITGGDMLLTVELFFLSWIPSVKFLRQTTDKAFWIQVCNLGLKALRWQIIIVYALSAISKWNDESWRNGEAISAIMRIKAFSMSWPVIENFPEWILSAVTWLVILFQSVLPLALLTEKGLKPFVILAVLFHLAIGLLNGLPAFSAIMIISLLLFFPFSQRKPCF